MNLLLRPATHRLPSAPHDALQPPTSPKKPWPPLLPTLAAAGCFVPLFAIVAFGIAWDCNGPVTLTVWCTAAGSLGLGLALQVASLLHHNAAMCGQGSERTQQRKPPEASYEGEETGCKEKWIGGGVGLSFRGPEWQQKGQQQPGGKGEAATRRRQQQPQCLNPSSRFVRSRSGSRLDAGAWIWSSGHFGEGQPPLVAAAATAGSAAIAYAEALRVVQGHRLMSYSSNAQSALVHLCGAEMQPEQLCPDWCLDLERRFSEQGWCLLSMAIRRGSTCISFSLANIRPSREAAAAAVAASPDAVATGTEPRAELPVGLGGAPGGDVGVGDVGTEANIPVTPEELLAGLGIRREELPPGYSLTMQAIADDGHRYRARYVRQQDGSWLRGALSASSPTSDTAASGAGGEQSGGQECSRCLRLPDAADSSLRSNAPRTYGRRPDLGGGRGSGRGGAGGSDSGVTNDEEPRTRPDSIVVNPFDAAEGDTQQDWVLCAPYVVAGATEPGGGTAVDSSGCPRGAQRYDAEVCVVAASWQAGIDAIATGPCGGSGQGGGATSRDPSVAHDCDIVFSVRPLGRPCKELNLRQVLVQRTTDVMTRGSEPELPGLRIDPKPRSGSRPLRNDGAITVRKWVWALTVWDEPATAVDCLPAVALPHGGDDGRGDGNGRREASAPLLVDLNAWRGAELLAARFMLFVPRTSAADGVTNGHSTEAAWRWIRELEDLLSLHPPGVAQHVLVDVGLFVSGALGGIAQAPLPPLVAAAAAPASEVDGGVQIDVEPAAATAAVPSAARAAATAASMSAGMPGCTAASRKPTASTAATTDATADADSCGTAADAPSNVAQLGRQLVLMLDLGTGLLSFALRHGCCALVKLVWLALERLGFGAEEVLLHGTGSQAHWPLLHAAIASGVPPAVDLVLSWYAAAGLPEPWLQPIQVPQSPAVLTPLALASASSRSGALMSYILRNRPQALAAWRVRVNGISSRSVAAAAGLWTVVLEADVRAALTPAAAALAAARRRLVVQWRMSRLAALLFGRGARGWGAILPLKVSHLRPRPPPLHFSRSVAGASCGGATTAAAAAASSRCSPQQIACRSWHQTAVGKAATAPAVAAVVGKTVGATARTGTLAMDLDMFVARGTRTQMVAFHVTIVMFQLTAQLKALLGSFQATCPTAAAAVAAASWSSGWAWLRMCRATFRCVGSRLWWTALEAGLAAAMASPLGLHHHPLCCAVAAAMRCLFQGTEGSLLPPSEMAAFGPQMMLAYVLFVLVTVFCYQAPTRLNIILRFGEGFAASRMLYKFGVTDQPQRAVVLAMSVEALGWALGAALRSRACAVLRRQQQQQRQEQEQ